MSVQERCEVSDYLIIVVNKVYMYHYLFIVTVFSARIHLSDPPIRPVCYTNDSLSRNNIQCFRNEYPNSQKSEIGNYIQKET